MELRPLALPIYSRALVYLAAMHFVAFIVGIAVDEWLSLASVAYFIPMIPASVVSLLCFRRALPLITKSTTVGALQVSVGMLAVVSCIAGGLALTAVICLLWGGDPFPALWFYLPLPVLSTLLAVVSRRHLIQTALCLSSDLNNQTQKQSPLC